MCKKQKAVQFTSNKKNLYNKLRPFYLIYKKAYSKLLQNVITRRKLKQQEPNHKLNKKLIVSLTSFPPRFKTLHLTVISLLTQKVVPDKLILWIATEDYNKLPNQVIELQNFGLTIKKCENIYSYKKIIPTLNIHPESFIATADDDVYYKKNWLRELVEEYRKSQSNVICHRAHMIILNDSQVPVEYSKWHHKINKRMTSKLIFPTGVGGVLYAPGAFHNDVMKKDIFTKLCPTADDVWLYWMHRLNKSKITTLGNYRYIDWTGSQKKSLFNINSGPNGMNDIAIEKILAMYGFPE